MANTVDELLEKLREQITTRRQESEERVGRIKAAADEYLKAIEADLVRDVAVRLGGLGDPTPQPFWHRSASELVQRGERVLSTAQTKGTSHIG